MSLIPKLTSAGQGLLVEALTGGTLNFTKIVIGSGDEPKSESTLTALVNTELELTINDCEKGDGSITLYASFDNKELEEGFNWTETGIIAKGDSGSETLYAYCNVGSEYEYVPSSDSGRLVTRTIIITVAVDDAENITVDLSGGTVFALKTDLDDHINDTNNPHSVTLSQLNAGAAAEKNVDTEISESSVNLPTSAAVYAAIASALKNIDTSDFLSKTSGGTVAAALTITGLLTASGGIAFTNSSTFKINDSGYLVLSLGEGFIIDNDVKLTSGTIQLYRDPTSDMDAATKQYVDNSLKDGLSGKADSSHTHSLWDTTFEVVFACSQFSDYQNWMPGGDEGNTNITCALFKLDTAIRPASLAAAMESISDFSIRNVAVTNIRQVTLDDATTTPDYVNTNYFATSAEVVIFSYDDVVKYVAFNTWDSKYGDISYDTTDTMKYSFSMSALKQTMLI